MNDMEIKAKSEEIAQDSQWMQALSEAETAEEAAALFAQKGVEVTAEELEQLVDRKDDSLSETELNSVAGGFGIVAGIGFMVAASVLAYGSAYALSRETTSWNKKKKK